MIDLTRHKDPARVLRNALHPDINPRGTTILYHEGDYGDGINNKPVGLAAWELAQAGLVHLFQKLISKEPRRYAYYAVVR